MDFEHMTENDLLKSFYIKTEKPKVEGNGEFSSFRDYEYGGKYYNSPQNVMNKEHKFYREHSDLKKIKVDEGTQEYVFFPPENRNKTLHLRVAEPGTWGFEPDEVISIKQKPKYKNLLTGEEFDKLTDANFPIDYPVAYRDGYYVSKAHEMELERRELAEEDAKNEMKRQYKKTGLKFKNLLTGEVFDNPIDAEISLSDTMIERDGYYVGKSHLKELTRREIERRKAEMEEANRFGSTFASTYTNPEFNAKMERFQPFRSVNKPFRGSTEGFSTGIASYYGKK